MVNKVTAKSTDHPTKEDLVNELMTNPYTFHHVTKSHMSFNGAFQEPEKFLPFAAKYIVNMKSQGVLIKEDKESFYIYEQISASGKSCKGVIGLCSVDDYRENRIKKHEEIRPSRLKFLVELFKTAHIMGEPTLLAHNSDINLDELEATEIYRFVSADHKTHVVRRVDSIEDVTKLQEEMAEMESFYIADGHHRSASTSEFNASIPGLDNDKSMCYIVHENQLQIHPFHRLIKPLHSLDAQKVIADLASHFKIMKSDKPLYTILESKNFGLYINKQWYLLSYESHSDQLDVEILEEIIVKGVFDIQDSRTDSQIYYHPYSNGLNELLDLVDSEIYSIAFTTKPCSFKDVIEIADSNKILPPKSTYIEPKLRAGLLIQEFQEI
jgi:uncharacterized protein (DUF1015 family)